MEALKLSLDTCKLNYYGLLRYASFSIGKKISYPTLQQLFALFIYKLISHTLLCGTAFLATLAAAVEAASI